MQVSKTAKAGKALVDFIGSASRTTIAMSDLESKLSAFKAIAPEGFPVLFAGGSIEAVATGDAKEAILGLVAAQVKVAGKTENETVYKCLLVSPLFDTDAILASGDAGKDWVAKIIEKETAHVQFRPIRNAEDGESLEDYAVRVPTTISDLVTAASRDKIDVEALSLLWPYFRAYVKAQKDSGNKVAEGTLRFLPGDKAIATVSKALRSASWAKRNTKELEDVGFWAEIGGVLVQMAQAPIPDPTPEDANATRTVDASVIADWLKTRDTVDIEPVVTYAEKDVSALESFMGSLKPAAAS